MVVRTAVSGMRGRHSSSGSRRPRAPIRVVLAVLGACLAIAAGTVAGLAAAGPGGPHRAPGGTVGTTGATSNSHSASQPNLTASAPRASPQPRSLHSPRASSPPGSSPRATPAAGPTTAAGRRDPFGSAAASYLSGRAGTVLAAVYDLGTGRSWDLGQGQPQAEASIVKLDVLEALLAEHDQDGGTRLPAADRSLTQQMIEDSDNDAATSLWYQVGGPARIRSFNVKAGLTDTVPSSCVVCPGFAWPGWGLTTTTPDDQIALLRQLVRPSSLLTSADRDYALSLMEDVTPSQRWGVSGGVPAQVTVALKNGWLPLRGADSDWQVNSVGWVSGGGRNYLIAVLTTGNPTDQYGIDTIEALAAMVWQHMG
jgi:beta-lactamase class A